jgi:hypothetical protein
VVGGYGEGDGLVVVFVGVVVHPVDAGAGFSESYVGEFVEDPPVSVGVRLVSVIGDEMQHAGQAAYLRGLIERLRLSG